MMTMVNRIPSTDGQNSGEFMFEDFNLVNCVEP